MRERERVGVITFNIDKVGIGEKRGREWRERERRRERESERERYMVPLRIT